MAIINPASRPVRKGSTESRKPRGGQCPGRAKQNVVQALKDCRRKVEAQVKKQGKLETSLDYEVAPHSNDPPV